MKPINYEAQKTKKFKTQIGRRENMQYDEQEDCYICTEGRTLHSRRESTQFDRQGRFRTMAIYRCVNCTVCQHRTECCKAKNDEPKEIKVSTELVRLSKPSQENITTPQGILLRINRSIQVEGALGVLKSDRKFKRFLMRGRTNISTALYLLCLAFDLRKLWSKCNTGRLKTCIAERSQICVTSVSLCLFLLLIAMFSTIFNRKMEVPQNFRFATPPSSQLKKPIHIKPFLLGHPSHRPAGSCCQCAKAGSVKYRKLQRLQWPETSRRT